jgi:hypothetical protein
MRLLTQASVRPPFLRVALPSSILPLPSQVTGYPGTCAPVFSLGLGFDLRMAMGVPDLWASVLSLHQEPETATLPMGHLAHILTQVGPTAATGLGMGGERLRGGGDEGGKKGGLSAK